MALQTIMEFSNGIQLPEAYIKITNILINYLDPKIVRVTVGVYKDLTSYNSGKQEVKSLDFKCNDYSYFDSNTLTIAECGYAWLKTLDTFSGATDV